MNNLMTTSATMSSREIAELTGKRHPDVKRDIINMLHDLIEDVSDFARIYTDGMNREQTEYVLDRDHTECLLTGYSSIARMKVIKRWRELETKPLSQLEIIAGMATGLVEIERKQNEHAEVVARLESELEEVKQGQNNHILPECPANAEGITSAKARVNAKHGVPGWAVDEILRGEYGPRPAGQVRNTHENANGSTYVVWYKGDVTRLFDRIAKECTRVTPTMVTHPQVSKRFKLI